MANEVEKAMERVEKLRAQIAAEEMKVAATQIEGEDAVSLARLAHEEATLRRRLETAKDANANANGGQRTVDAINNQTVLLTAEPSDTPMNPPPSGAPQSANPDAASYEEMVKQSNTGLATGLTTTQVTTPSEVKATTKGKE